MDAGIIKGPSGYQALRQDSDISSTSTKTNSSGASSSSRQVSFGSTENQKVSTDERKAVQERLSEVAGRRGGVLAGIARVLGGLTLGMVGGATAVLALGLGIAGAVATAIPAGIAACIGGKSAAMRTLNFGAEAGMTLARLPLEILGYALKSPGALLGALANKIWPDVETTKSKELLAAFNDKTDSVLNKLQDGKMDKLMASRPTFMSADQVKSQVLLGESLVNEIMSNPEGKAPSLPPNNATVKAIVWYLTAKGVETSGETYTRGTFNMVDPDHKLMRYMASAPTCHGRISTHFASRSLSPSDLGSRISQDGILSAPMKQPVQYGIEDFGFTGSLPNGMHAILFDAMMSKDPVTGKEVPQTMMKLETFGMPTVNRLMGHSDSSWDVAGKLGNAVLSLSHCAQHSMNFLTSKLETGGHEMTFREGAKERPVKLLGSALEELKADKFGLDKTAIDALKKVLVKGSGIDQFFADLGKEANQALSDALHALTMKDGKKYMDVINTDLAQRGKAEGYALRQGGEIIINLPGSKLKQD